MYMAVIAVLLLSCNNGNPKNEKTVVADMALSPAEKPAYQLAADSGKAAFEPPQTKHTSTTEDWDKKIIKTAEVTLELKDYSGYNQTLHKGLKAFGAYIAA